MKYLGVLIDSHLTFKIHIDDLTKKNSRGIGILDKLRHYVTRKILTNVFCAIMLPFPIIWYHHLGSASNTLLVPLHILQKKFVWLATFNDTYPVYP